MARSRYLFALLLLHTVANAQSLRMPVSATYIRLTGYSRQFTDAFSSDGNLGALGRKQAFSAGLYSEKRFLLKDLNSFHAALVLPAASGNFAWKGRYSGGASYNESAAGLAYGRLLGPSVMVGVQFSYFSLKTAGYGKASTVGFDAGMQLQLSPQLSAGLQASNPISVSWGKTGLDPLPATYTLGLGYDLSPQVFIALEAEKTEEQPVSINAGLHYVVAEKLVARTGISTATELYYLGLGFHFVKTLRIDATVSIHPYLGTTPGLLILYSAKK